jgi:hypothetical protein
MKNTFKLIGIIALVAVIGFSMAACGDDDGGGGGGGGGIDFSVRNDSTETITNIKVFDWDRTIGGSLGEKVGDAKYDSGTISIAHNVTHAFKVSGLPDRGGEAACFQIEVTSTESEEPVTLITTNGYWYPAEFKFWDKPGFGLSIGGAE